MYVPLIFAPFLPIPATVNLFLVLGCICVGSAAIQIVSPIYNDWLAEMIPANSRGWFFSRRNAMQAGVGAIASFAGGFILDSFSQAGRDREGFAVIFGLGVVFAIISQFYFNRMTEMERENPIRTNLREGIRAMGTPFRDREFRRTLTFLFVFVFASGFAGNLFGAYAFESLKMSMTALQFTAICHAVGNIASIRLWGFLGDKYGNKPVLAILTVGIATTPLPWIFCRPGDDLFNAAILGIGHILAGICWGGISVCQFNILLATAKDDDRANYIGAGMALQAFVGALSPLLGAILMSALRPMVGVMPAYHWIFIVTMVIRALTLLFLQPVKEHGSTSIRGTLHELSRISPSGIKAMRTMTRTDDEFQREEAIATAGHSRFDIARDEVIKALHDPSPRVRRQASASLANLGGAGAVEGLLHILREHPDLVEEEAIEALGRLGDESAVSVLGKYLKSPRPLARRAAARAIGQIGGIEGAELLRHAAAAKDDPDLRRAALQGLRFQEYREASAEIADALLDPLPSVRVAAAEAVSEMELDGAAPYLRRGLELYYDEAGSELAYALGCVGNESDIPLILAEAQRGVSMITRRRCLLGVARLLDVEHEVYRLLLLEGMARDTAMMQMFGAKLRRDRKLREAVEAHARDDDAKALGMLKDRSPEFAMMAAGPCNELFIVAACAAIKK
ncbi:MAG: MFS transporter [Chthonomonas sp.]|nr:MFS transporter [Chthonomonas sp.]